MTSDEFEHVLRMFGFSHAEGAPKESRAAGYWMEQACRDHNRAYRLEAALHEVIGFLRSETEADRPPSERAALSKYFADYLEDVIQKT